MMTKASSSPSVCDAEGVVKAVDGRAILCVWVRHRHRCALIGSGAELVASGWHTVTSAE